MRCPSEFVHAQFADGELPEGEAGELIAHLEVCADCRKLAAALKEENRVLIRNLQGVDWWESEQAPVRQKVTELVSIGRLAAVFFAIALMARAGLSLITNVALPAGLNWLFPLNFSGQLNWFANGFFYIIGEGGSMMTSLVNEVGFALLSLFALGILLAVTRRIRGIAAMISVTALMCAFIAPGYAIDLRKAEGNQRNVTIAASETVDDTLVVFADAVNIGGTITGDLIVFSRQISVQGTVQGNIIGFAQGIDITGNVEGDIFGFAQSIQANGHVGQNFYGFGQTVTLGTGVAPEHDATIFGANANVNGNVGNDLTVLAGSLDVGSKIGRDLRFRGGQLSVHDPSTIGRNLDAVTNSEKDTQIDSSVTIAGKKMVEYTKPKPSRYLTTRFYFWQIIKIGAAFVMGLLLFWLFPGVSRVSLSTGRALLTSGGIGFLAAVAAPVAALILAITLIGLPIAFVIIALWLLGLYLAKIVIAKCVGEAIMRKRCDGMSAVAVALIVGLVVIAVAANLPLIGGIVNFFLFLIGLGALVITAYRVSGWRSKAEQTNTTPISLP
jgi:hypothetical protein